MPYRWTRQVSVEAFEWESVADEWLHHLGVALHAATAGTLSQTGQASHEFTWPYLELTAVGPAGNVDTRLLVLIEEHTFELLVGGHDAPDDDVAEAWVAAARTATSRLGQRGAVTDWTALLAAPTARTPGAESMLAGEVAFDVFRLRPAGQALIEPTPNLTSPHLHQVSRAVSWPILVEGSHEGYDWPSTSRRAAFDLRRIAALLSLDTFVPWVVRVAPMFRQTGDPPQAVPESGRPAWAPAPDFMPDETPQKPPDTKWTPDWLPDAWQRLQAKPWLGDAVVSQHEGLLVQLEHPSLAMVAFVAAIEAVSNRLFVERRCADCDAHRDVSGRFRATLRLVLTDDEAAWLEQTYKPRSLTVHQGRLHGTDAAPGAWHSFNDARQGFEWEVHSMRRASGRLLRRALAGRLPTTKRDYDGSKDPWTAEERGG